MKGYWHFAAITVTIAYLTLEFHYIFLIGFSLWLGYLYYDGRLRKTPFLFCLAISLISIMYLQDNNKAVIANKDEQLRGSISSDILITDKKVEFTFYERQLETKLLVLFFPKANTSKAEIKKEIQTIKHGAACVINGKLELPSAGRNPGQFDYQEYLLSKGITHQVILDSPLDIKCQGSSYIHRFYKLRSDLISYVESRVSEDTSSWLTSLVLGDDSKLSDETVELFQRWGLSHIIAISGSNIALLLAIIYFLLIKLNLFTKEKAQFLVLLFLPIYGILAGGEPSVWRACIMVMIFIIVNQFKFNLSVTDVLSITFLILTLADKNILNHVGFQFSFMVTFGLLLSKHLLVNTTSLFMQTLLMSFVSQMVIIPLQFTYFSMLQPLSILINVIVVPYFSIFAIPLMYILLPLSFLPKSLLHIIDTIFVKVHHTVILFVQWLDGIANYPFIIGPVAMTFAIAYFVLYFAFMNQLARGKLWRSFRIGILLTIFICTAALRPYFSPIGTVTMLDIGQGDAFVIELPYRKGVIMIDAGAKFNFNDMQATDSVSKQIIKPYLYSRGINKIDALFLTHEDTDHNGSVSFMVNDLEIGSIIVSDYYQLSPEELQLLGKHNIKIQRVNQGDSVVIQEQKFHVIAPTHNHHNHYSNNENSLVLYTELGGQSWLFTGDISIAQEEEIIKTYPRLTVDILKIAHHGSNTSSSMKFLERVSPSIGLISVGENNSYGHPTNEVLDSLIAEDISILRTDTDGAVQYRFSGAEGVFLKYLP